MRQKSRPIDRITDLLNEIDDLRVWINLALSDHPHVHPVPPPIASTWEKAIRSARSRTERGYLDYVDNHRKAQRLSRARLSDDVRVRSRGQFGSLSTEQMAAIEAEIEAQEKEEKETQPPELTTQKFAEYEANHQLPTADNFLEEKPSDDKPQESLPS